MTEAAQLDVLRNSSETRRLLEQEFDFWPVQVSTVSHLFDVSKNPGIEVIAKDKSGGEFALCRGELPQRPLLYVSSEGQAGIIARSLEGGLSTMTEIPQWQDCLKFSGGGQLDEMRRAFDCLSEDHRANAPRMESNRRTLRASIALPVLKDAIESLYSAVTELSPLFPIRVSDGCQFAGLFNKFTVMSNPVWRKRLSNS